MKQAYYVSLTALLLLFSSISFSQVQIGVHGSRLEGTASSQWGFGGHAKFLIADKMALGLSLRGYPKDMKTESVTIDGTNYKVARGNTIVPVTGSLDYYFGETMLRPYIGADLGAYFTQHVFAIREDNGGSSFYNTTNKKTYFGATPRLGLNIELGAIGLFGQAGYNFMFGSGDPDEITVPGITTRIDTKPADKFWTFDIGVFLKVGGKK